MVYVQDSVFNRVEDAIMMMEMFEAKGLSREDAISMVAIFKDDIISEIKEEN